MLRNYNKYIIFLIFLGLLLSITTISATTNVTDTNITQLTKQTDITSNIVKQSNRTVKQESNEIYVTSSGYDSATGTSDDPTSLTSALSRVQNDGIIYLSGSRRDTYTINNTINISSQTTYYDVVNFSIVGQKGKIITFDAKYNCQIFNISSGYSITFDNVQFTRGNGTGAAIYNQGNLTLKNCTLYGNRAGITNATESGGAIYSIGRLSLYDNEFRTNNATGQGGSVFSASPKEFVAEGNTFSLNQANMASLYIGSGVSPIKTERVLANITNNKFINNVVDKGSGAIYLSGKVYANISDNTFENNVAKTLSGGAISTESNSNITLSNNIFRNNSGQDGGAISSSSSAQSYFVNNTFINNTASRYAGALRAINVTAINNTFINNTGQYGGAIQVFDKHGTLINNTIINNTATRDGSAVYAFTSQNVTLINNTISNNIANNNGTIFAGNIKMQGNILSNNRITRGTVISSNTINATNNTFINNTNNLTDYLFNAKARSINASENIYAGNFLNVSFDMQEEYVADINSQFEINMSLNPIYNDTIRNGSLYIVLDDEIVDIVNVTNNTAIITLNYTQLKVGENYFSLEYMAEDNSYHDDIHGMILTINDPREIPQITVDLLNSTVTNTTINIIITNNQNELVTDGNITVLYNNEQLHQITNNGTNYLTLNIDKTGSHNITIIYSGNDEYASNSLTKEIIIDAIPITLQINDVIGYVNEPVNITVTINDDYIVNDGNIEFIINDQTYMVPVTNNSAVLEYTSNTQLNNNITVKYVGNDKYTANDTQASLTINKIDLQLVIEPATIILNQTTQLTATITNDLNKTVNDGKIIFKINGKTLRDSNGKIIYALVNNSQAIANYTAFADTQTEIIAIYSGTTNYDSTRSNTTTFIIQKRNANIELSIMINVEKTILAITSNVTDEITNQIVATGRLIFKINGKTLKDIDNKILYFDINSQTVEYNYDISNLSANKQFTLTAVYTDNQYNRQEATKTFNKQ